MNIFGVPYSVTLTLSTVLLAVPPIGPPADTATVATVNGAPCQYKRIKTDSDTLIQRFRKMHGRDPNSDLELAAIQEKRLEDETKRLNRIIRGILREQCVSMFKMDPSETEVARRWQEARPKMDIDADIARSRIELQKLVDALKDVVDGGLDADHVYRQRLSGTMSRQEWESRLEHQGIPEVVAQLEHQLTLPASELFNPAEVFRGVLINEQLHRAIEKDLATTDAEFGEYLRLLETDPTNEKIRSRGRNYRAAKRFEWWQDRYHKASVEIHDSRFRSAWTEPFGVATPAQSP